MTVVNPLLDLKEVQITPFHNGLIIKGFSCGDDGIDSFVNKKAAKHHELMRTRVFCAHRKGSTTVIGIYTLAMRIEETSKLLPDENKFYSSDKHFPALYIQSLAVVKRYHRNGLGKLMLMNALQRAYYISQNAAVFGVALRSLNDRTTLLYEKYGFRKREDCQYPLMILPMWTLRDLINPN